VHDAAPIGQREVGGASALFVVLVALPFVSVLSRRFA